MADGNEWPDPTDPVDLSRRDVSLENAVFLSLGVVTAVGVLVAAVV